MSNSTFCTFSDKCSGPYTFVLLLSSEQLILASLHHHGSVIEKLTIKEFFTRTDTFEKIYAARKRSRNCICWVTQNGRQGGNNFGEGFAPSSLSPSLPLSLSHAHAHTLILLHALYAHNPGTQIRNHVSGFLSCTKRQKFAFERPKNARVKYFLKFQCTLHCWKI